MVAVTASPEVTLSFMTVIGGRWLPWPGVGRGQRLQESREPVTAVTVSAVSLLSSLHHLTGKKEIGTVFSSGLKQGEHHH